MNANLTITYRDYYMAIKDEQVRIKAPTRVETGFTTINGLFSRMVEWLENLYFQEETSGSFFETK